MLFSIIFTRDCAMSEPVLPSSWETKEWFKNMDETEAFDGEPDEWCGDLWGEESRHRKWCGILNKQEFENFLCDTSLVAEAVQCMGSIGAPGCGIGIAPCISFHMIDGGYQEPNCIHHASVTPLPATQDGKPIKSEWAERDWERVRTAVIKRYGNEW